MKYAPFRTTSLIITSVFMCAFPMLALANPTYQPLVGIPGIDGSRSSSLSEYLNQLYMVAIAVGAIIAFIKISLAGVKWSLSDIVTDKSDARNDIKGALLGLFILLIPFAVLNTIYGGLTNLSILDRAAGVRINSSTNTTGSLTNPGTGPTTYPQGTVMEIMNNTVTSCSTAECALNTAGSYDSTENAAKCEKLGGVFSDKGNVSTCIYDGKVEKDGTVPTCLSGEVLVKEKMFMGWWGNEVWRCRKV